MSSPLREEGTRMTFFLRCCLSSLVGLAALVVPHPATGQVKVLLDNDQVRIYEATMATGYKTKEHSHQTDEATYVFSGGKVKIRLSDISRGRFHM
jgi:hypothetical protein